MRIFKQKIFRVEYFEYLWQTLSPMDIAFIYRGYFIPFFQVQERESLLCTFLETVYIVSELKAWYCVAQKKLNRVRGWVGLTMVKSRSFPWLKVLKIKVWLNVMWSHYSWDILKLVSITLHLRTVFLEHLWSNNRLYLWMLLKERRFWWACFSNLCHRLQIFLDAFPRKLKPHFLLLEALLLEKLSSQGLYCNLKGVDLRNKSSVIPVCQLISFFLTLSWPCAMM